jgi:hypothetical protein
VIVSPKRAKQFPPSLKKVKIKSVLPLQSGKQIEIDVPDGIIAHLTRECSGNVHATSSKSRVGRSKWRLVGQSTLGGI